MNSLLPAILHALLVLPVLVFPLLTQTKPSPTGRWEGAIQADHELKFILNLARNDKGEWAGTISIPEQNSRDVPLNRLSVNEAKVSFSIEGVPGDPTVTAEIAADGKTLKGELSQHGAIMPLQASRTGEAEVRMPEKSTAVAKEFEGAWEGVLEPPGSGMQLHLVLKLANGSDGATGTLTSVDQGNTELALSGISQQGDTLKFEVRLVSGSYAGKLTEGKITGEWTQMATLPLTFQRAKK